MMSMETFFFFLAGFGFHFLFNFALWAGRSLREEYFFWRESVASLRTIGNTLRKGKTQTDPDDSNVTRSGRFFDIVRKALDILGNRYIAKMLIRVLMPSSERPLSPPLFVPVRPSPAPPSPSPPSGRRADFYANYDHTVHPAPEQQPKEQRHHRHRQRRRNVRPQANVNAQIPVRPVNSVTGVVPDPNVTPDGSHPDVTALGHD